MLSENIVIQGKLRRTVEVSLWTKSEYASTPMGAALRRTFLRTAQKIGETRAVWASPQEQLDTKPNIERIPRRFFGPKERLIDKRKEAEENWNSSLHVVEPFGCHGSVLGYVGLHLTYVRGHGVGGASRSAVRYSNFFPSRYNNTFADVWEGCAIPKAEILRSFDFPLPSKARLILLKFGFDSDVHWWPHSLL